MLDEPGDDERKEGGMWIDCFGEGRGEVMYKCVTKPTARRPVALRISFALYSAHLRENYYEKAWCHTAFDMRRLLCLDRPLMVWPGTLCFHMSVGLISRLDLLSDLGLRDSSRLKYRNKGQTLCDRRLTIIAVNICAYHDTASTYPLLTLCCEGST